MILQRKVSSKFIKINKINCILHVNRYLFIFYLLSSKYFPTVYFLFSYTSSELKK